MDRSDRRRQVAADKSALAPGLDVRNRDGFQIAALMRIVHELVRTSMARQSVAPLMHWLYDNMTKANKAFASAVEIDCRKGCFHCCQMWVDASPPEILYLARNLPARERATAIARINNAIAISGHMDFEERGAFVSPCPMLLDGACSVYAVRPIACRSAASLDAEVCQRAYNLHSDEQIPLPLPYMLLGSGYRLALAGAIKKAGLRHQAVELNSGLRIAVHERNAEARWLSRDDPFVDALRPPTDDIFHMPAYRSIYEAAFDGY